MRSESSHNTIVSHTQLCQKTSIHATSLTVEIIKFPATSDSFKLFRQFSRRWIHLVFDVLIQSVHQTGPCYSAEQNMKTCQIERPLGNHVRHEIHPQCYSHWMTTNQGKKCSNCIKMTYLLQGHISSAMTFLAVTDTEYYFVNCINPPMT
jgi:hypothetical protein